MLISVVPKPQQVIQFWRSPLMWRMVSEHLALSVLESSKEEVSSKFLEILVFSLPYTREHLLCEREHVSRPTFEAEGVALLLVQTLPAPSLPFFLELFLFRCFLFGRATSAFEFRRFLLLHAPERKRET